MAAFACGRGYAAQKRPQRGLRAEAARIGTPAGVDHEEVSPTELVEATVERIEKHRIRPTISETQAMPNLKSIMR